MQNQSSLTPAPLAHICSCCECSSQKEVERADNKIVFEPQIIEQKSLAQTASSLSIPRKEETVKKNEKLEQKQKKEQ